MADMRQVSTSKGSQHPTKPNETYIGKIKFISNNGTASVSIAKLNIVIDNCKIIDGIRPLQKLDRVVCGFLDGQQREMVIFGAYQQSGGVDSSIILANQIFS